MSQQLLQHVQSNSKSLKKNQQPVKTGNTVRIHQRITEGSGDTAKQRIQIFEGLVIAVNSGSGTDSTFTVRKIASGVGVEKIFPIHSSNIEKIEIIRNSKVTQAKLYFMRERTGKSARLKEAKMMTYEFPEEVEASEESIQEAVEANEAAEETAKTEESAEATTETTESTPETTEEPVAEEKEEAKEEESKEA
jgi:large subunit ribosomal protein L19